MDDVSDALDAFDRRWAERQRVFEQRTHHRMLELVVLPNPGNDDARALDVARRHGVPESVRPSIQTVRDPRRGPYAFAVGSPASPRSVGSSGASSETVPAPSR